MDLGKKYTCFECGTKFYDLGRPEPICPRCGVDQRLAPGSDYVPAQSDPRRVATSTDDAESEVSAELETPGDLDEELLEEDETDFGADALASPVEPGVADDVADEDEDFD